MRLSILLIACLTLLSCDGGGSSGGSGSTVGYTVDCAAGVQCSGADDISEYTSPNSTTVRCTWLCSPYEEGNKRYVAISFQKYRDQCWEKSGEYISGGICN